MSKRKTSDQQQDFDRIQAEAFASLHKRGKVTPVAHAKYGMTNGDGTAHDPSEAFRVLDEALRD